VNHQEIKLLLNKSLLDLKVKISQEDCIDIEEYIAHYEFELAYDLMEFLYNKHEIKPSLDHRKAATLMGLKRKDSKDKLKHNKAMEMST